MRLFQPEIDEIWNARHHLSRDPDVYGFIQTWAIKQREGYFEELIQTCMPGGRIHIDVIMVMNVLYRPILEKCAQKDSISAEIMITALQVIKYLIGEVDQGFRVGILRKTIAANRAFVEALMEAADGWKKERRPGAWEYTSRD